MEPYVLKWIRKADTWIRRRTRAPHGERPTPMDVNRPAPTDLLDHLAALRRNWWLIAALTGLGILTGAGATAHLPHIYQATTSVLVLPVDGQDSNAAGGRTKNTINLDTEAQLVHSTAVASRARQSLHEQATAGALGRQVTVSVPPNSTILRIAFAADSPQRARSGSHAFATAYLTNRSSNAATANTAATRALRTQVGDVTKELLAASRRLATVPAGSPEQLVLETQRHNLSTQLDDLTNRLTNTTTSPVDAGRIISDASTPSAPIRPVLPVNLAAGGLIGLLLGLLIALLRARLGRVVHRADDMHRHAIPVLTTLPNAPTRMLTQASTGGRMFSRLRNELSAGPQSDQLIAVIGTSDGPAATIVATNLAAAFSRTGTSSLLVAVADGRTGADPTAADLLALPAAPGWTELTTGTAGLDTVLHNIPGEPYLRAITGGTGSAGSLCQSEAARAALHAVRAEAVRIVVAGPDATSSADAQSLAGLADAAILTVELGVSRHEDVVDTAEQLARIGTPLLGAVLVPALDRSRSAVPGRHDSDLADLIEPAEPNGPAELAATAAAVGPGAAGRESRTATGRQSAATDPAARTGSRPGTEIEVSTQILPRITDEPPNTGKGTDRAKGAHRSRNERMKNGDRWPATDPAGGGDDPVDAATDPASSSTRF